ncbi:MAG: ABC transporter ATP-binding protein [Thalassobaculales bacterium]
MTALLEVEGLSVILRTARGPAVALRDLSFRLEAGETLGLVGESGCGKSMTALALMGLLPEGAAVSGSIRFRGQELAGAPEASLAALRGNRIAMVFQEPMTSLNPLLPIGRQVAEPLVWHRGMAPREARAEALRLLEKVGLPDPARRLDAYPHQISGGQRQRVMIAVALACGPDLLIADEPTTALDVTIQGQILDLIAGLVEESGMALILVSHNLGVIAESVSRVAVMYGGTIVEDGPTEAVFNRLAHPYSQGLFAALPRLDARPGDYLPTIAGTVPELADLPPGCRFADRCTLAVADCAEVPPVVDLGQGHHARCFRVTP